MVFLAISWCSSKAYDYQFNTILIFMAMFAIFLFELFSKLFFVGIALLKSDYNNHKDAAVTFI